MRFLHLLPPFSVGLGMMAASLFGAPAQDHPRLQDQVWRATLGRTGEFVSPGPRSAPREKWRFATGGPVRSSPVVAGGVVYIGSDDGVIYALDLATGAERWRFATGKPVRSSAAVFGGKVFFNNEAGLHALDAANGLRLWRVEAARWDDSPLVIPGPVPHVGGRVLEGVVFYSQPWRNLVGVDVADGTEVWRFRDGHGPGANGSSALVHRGLVIHFRGSQATELVDLLTERRVYSIDGAIDSGYFTPAARDGICYSYIRGVVAFDIEANRVNAPKGNHLNNYTFKWRFDRGRENQWDFQHPGISSISVDATTVYFGHSDNHVYALNRETGEQRWATRTGGPNRSSPAIGTGELVFIGSHDRHVYGLAKADGAVRWRFETGGQVHSSPAPAGAVLVIGSDDGVVRALE